MDKQHNSTSETADSNFSSEFCQHPRDCPLCSAAQTIAHKTPYSRGLWHVVRCPQCSFVYQNTAPSEDLLNEELAWERTHATETERRKKMRPVVKASSAKLRHIGRRIFGRRQAHVILQQYATPGPVIDLGCGSGGQICEIREDFTPYGVEISKLLAQEAQKRLSARGGHVVHDSAIDGLKTFPDNFFTSATLRSYLEHESRPRDVLKSLYHTLKPEAAVIIKVPNFASWNRVIMQRNWCGFRWPDHLNYFTPSTLTLMATNTGFFLQKIWASPFSDNLWILFRRKKSTN